MSLLSYDNDTLKLQNMQIKLDNDGQIIILDNDHIGGYDHINLTIKEGKEIITADCISLDGLLSALEAFKKQRELSHIYVK